MKLLTIVVITARAQPEIGWLIDSLRHQRVRVPCEILVVDSTCFTPSIEVHSSVPYRRVPPKPCTWSGPHRLTSCDWWSKPNSINTALALVKTPWVLLLDDRGILSEEFMEAVTQAINERYIMAGSYEKRTGMIVMDGRIYADGKVIGKDGRLAVANANPFPCPGNWLYGCVTLLPLEWALAVNGSPEQCCALSFEDVIFGLCLANNGFPIRFDRRAALIEDRSPDKIGTPIKRSAKDRFPHDEQDKAHTMLRLVKDLKRFEQPFGDIEKLREDVQSGLEFPNFKRPVLDWYDGQPLINL